MRCLNLGCGRDIRPQYVNLDLLRFDGTDVSCDLDKRPYPFPTDCFDEVYCQHVLEHLQDLGAAMAEIHRVLKPSGLAKVICPYYVSQNAFHPEHKQVMMYGSLDFVCEPGYHRPALFRMLKRRICFLSGQREGIRFLRSRWYSWPFDSLINLLPVVYERFLFFRLPASEIHYLLWAVK